MKKILILKIFLIIFTLVYRRYNIDILNLHNFYFFNSIFYKFFNYLNIFLLNSIILAKKIQSLSLEDKRLIMNN